MSAGIPFDRAKLAELCRRHHIHRLAFFGSVLRDDFRADSDIDVLVEFEPNEVVGLRLVRIERELSQSSSSTETTVGMRLPVFIEAPPHRPILLPWGTTTSAMQSQ